MRSGHLLLVSTTQQSAPVGYFVPAVRLTPRQVLSIHRAGGGEVESQVDVLDPSASRVPFGQSRLPRVGSLKITMVHLRVRLRSP